MENSTEEVQERGGASTEINEEEIGPTEEKSHNLKGTINGRKESPESGGEKLHNGDRGGGGGGAEGGDLSSINAMMSTVMMAAESINGGGDGEGESGVTSANSSAGPSPSPSPSKSVTAMRAPPSRNARRNQDTKDDSSAYICPLCDKNCQTQHQLTMHIRQHNADTGATDHSCSICGKCLSSASSLDRHMLVHSGERPYKCLICGQTFTTNGNMHRHMKIHDKDPATGMLPICPPTIAKRRRPSVKRRQGLEEENGEEPPSKKVVEDVVVAEDLAAVVRGSEEELLPCPICFKTCSSRLELDAHMDTHPDTALRCDLCCLSFRTHRGLLRHNAVVHKLLPQDPSGRPFIQNNPSIPSGFNDLAFIDFSCKKFTHIAQVWCETNLRRCISKFHRFVCDGCDKAFPLRSALDLHKTTLHADEPTPTDTEDNTEQNEVDTAAENGVESNGQGREKVLRAEQASFLEELGLQHISTVKSGPTDDEIHQAHLDSIKVIHVEPPCSSLPQEPASSYLSGGLGLTLGLGVGGLAALSIPLLEASSLQGLSQKDTLSLLSMQPFQTGFLLQPDGGAATASATALGAKPGEVGGAGIMELADIQQILKVATAAPNQMGLTLPPLAKAPGHTGGQGQVQGQKAMPPLKPKPPITPRSSLTATTPPPLQSSQQASLGCISPSLPPPTPTLFKTPSSSSSSAGSGEQMDAECTGDAHTPLSDSPPAATTAVHEDAGLSGRKPGSKGGNGASAASTKGSFPCRFCDQVFDFSGVLQAHMRFHLGILPHQCNICDYVAPDKATLIRHLRTHSGERPYVCRVCHYPFTVKANCERHLRKKHAKTSRKDIEKNIKYVTSTTTASIASAITTTAQDMETGCTGAETTCRFCGEDLKTYRALQIHLRTHNGCQKKPFECRRCGAAFLAKRNCIHHLLKQHPEVQEREIEEHITTLQPAAIPVSVTPARAAPVNQMVLNGISQPPIQEPQAVKVEELVNVVYSAELDQPLDFSAKGRGAGSQVGSPGVKLESISPSFDCSTLDQPIDLSIPSKRQRRDAAAGDKREIKTEQSGSSIIEQHHALALALAKDEKVGSALQPHPQLGCYQLPPGSAPPATSHPNPNNSARAQRLKPLLPKPASATTSSPVTAVKDLPPLASIAQIIHSVSGAPDLLKREVASLDCKPQGVVVPTPTVSASDGPGPSAGLDLSDDSSEGSSRKRSRKKPSTLALKEKTAGSGGGIDLESSGEFASVEKMLATTDANKFSTYLQTGAAELAGRRDDEGAGGGDEKEGGGTDEMKPVVMVPPPKGKKNAYSNSVQKMTCPFCPRVFPWASSLQRHMLTHTGQKPFPCPKCDAFFSTKSNCERHLLRKHGVTHRTLRRNGAIAKKDGDEGSHESAESQSETEQVAPEAQDLSNINTSSDSGSTPQTESPAPAEQEAYSAAATSPAPQSQGCSPSENGAKQPEAETLEQSEPQGAPETRAAQRKQSLLSNSTKVESGDDDDCHSNKSLDLNFGKKLIDFKLSRSSDSAQEEQSSQPCSSSSSSVTSSTSASQVAAEQEKEKIAAATTSSGSSNPVVKQQPEYKHVCRVCKKSFRYATTLARHERAHLSEETSAPASVEETSQVTKEVMESSDTKPAEEKEEEQKEMEGEAEDEGVKGAESDAGESGESEEEEKEERSDEEASEPKSLEGGEASGGRVDKRKKICNVCGKRFWSLQDLTRHMRSHTGERPYRCQTCERTFTLKHSLVRHQRIHLKPRGTDGFSAANEDASEDGDSRTPTPTSTCPPSENESECGSSVAGAKELEEEDVKEEGDVQQESGDGAEQEHPVKTEEPDSEDKSKLGAESSSQQATDATTSTTEYSSASKPKSTTASNDSKDSTPSSRSSSSSPLVEATTAAPAEGFIQGLLEIHALPNGEPPLVGVD